MTSMLVISGLALGSMAGCRSEKTEGVATVATPRSEATMMNTAQISERATAETRVKSNDGTMIAFEKTGRGPALIVVSGALAYRDLHREQTQPLIAKLAERFTVFTYDRRGRGESTDVQPYAVEREIEDLDALIHHAGGSAQLYGVSSGAALALRAAAKLGPAKVSKLALYEPPYGQKKEDFAKQSERVNELARDGQPGDAAAFFMTAIGTPPEALEAMKASPEWEKTKKIDFTLAYDYAVLGDGAVPEEVAAAIRVPTLVMTGEKTMGFMHPTADRLAKLVPRAERKTLQGQAHQAAAEAVAPVLIEFFTSERAGARKTARK
jgi:pimeloyl-ACP methyl ester carboxylesterase